MATGEILALVMADGVSVTAGTPAPGGSGGGGGAGAAWHSPDGLGAPASQIGSEKVYLFPDSFDGEIWLTLVVAAGYQVGNPIALDIGWFADSTTLTVKLKATTYLVAAGDAFTDTTNAHNSTNAAQSNGSPTLLMQTATLDLTEADGEINAVAVAVGDALRVKVTRDYANDTDTGTAYVVPSATQVRFSA